MIKRIFLFLLTNILVIVLIGIVLAILSSVFGINISGYFQGGNYISVLIYASVVGFSGAIISLLLSKQMAKWSYDMNFITAQNVHQFASKEQNVYYLVERLSREHRIEIPEVAVYLSPEPNAFATGATKNSSLIAVSSGLLDTMTQDEIDGVVAHELAHVVNGDMVTMTLLQGVINTFVIFLSRIIASIVSKALSSNSDEESSSSPSWIYYLVSMVLEILFSILASLVVMAFSRHREYRADEGSAQIVGKQKMIAALRKLQKLQENFITDDSDKLATMKIGSKKRSGIFALFASHPDLEDRIQNLENKML